MHRSAFPLLLSAGLLSGLSPAAAAPVPSASKALVEGARSLEAGRDEAALSSLRLAASEDGPLRDLAWVLLGEAALELGQPERALEAARLAEAAVPRSVRGADADWLGARALVALGRPGEAAEAFAAFAREHPKDARTAGARRREAEALETAGRVAAASEGWRQLALELPAAVPDDALGRAERLAAAAGERWRPPTGEQLLARADALAEANLHPRAVAAYEAAGRALGEGPSADAALLRRARSLYRLRRNDESAAACLELAARFPGSNLRTAALHRRARVAWRQDDGETLLAATQEARDDPRHRGSSWRDDLLHVRAGYFMEKRRWDEAVAAFEQVLREHPKSDLADDSRWKAAWCRLLQGRAEEAAERFADLAERGSDEELVRAASYWSGVVADRLGERGTARARLERTYLSWPFRYHGIEARRVLARWLGAEEIAGLDARVEASGEPFIDPGPLASEDPRAVRYGLLREAALHDFALDEIEDLRRTTSDTDALVFELARARSRCGAAAAGYGLLARRFWKQLEHPSRRSPPVFWEVAYPRPWGVELDRWCSERGLDASLAAGLVRSESWWNPGVRSGADARGLMQLIPDTGRRMAALEGIGGFDADRLFEPELNLRLGTRYLADLSSRLGGDAAAVVASYNAGEDKVAAWWAAFDAEGVDFGPERVARIPYAETRGYVRRVLEAAGWYRWLDRGAGKGTESGR